jgi:CheY-like chemotaxis protein
MALLGYYLGRGDFQGACGIFCRQLWDERFKIGRWFVNSIVVRCRDCGTRKSIVITDGDRRTLDEQNYFTRFCSTCAIVTRWTPSVAGALWEPLVIRDPTQFEGDEEEVGPRVLLIDDDEAILKVIGKALKIANCDVTTANSARDAAMLLARGDFDVIISDIHMPEFDGIQLFEFLQKHFPEHTDRVIFVTGDTGAETLQFVLGHHARMLPKPIDIHELLSLVKPDRRSAEAS